MPHKAYPPPSITNNKNSKKTERNSNLELYRIIVMLLIVAHHYVVNSGLIQMIANEPLNITSSVMLVFGAWGKTGINCFVLITGYFMCRSRFTGEKLLKLYLQILFYTVIIYGVFCVTGHERLSVQEILWKIWPVKSINNGFTSCFILFYLFIPFLNIFLTGLDQKNHRRLLIVLLFSFSLLPTIPVIPYSFNYVGWFMVLYLVGSYIRNYGIFSKLSHRTWGLISIGLVMVASVSVLGMATLYKLDYAPSFSPYFFISDSNKILSLAIAVTSFMYFKDLRIPHSRLINAVGGATFGVLLIHANSDAMRAWLWKENIDCVGNYSNDILWTLGYATGCVLVIFTVCAGIDWFRGRFIEPYLITCVKNIFRPVGRKASKFLNI